MHSSQKSHIISFDGAAFLDISILHTTAKLRDIFIKQMQSTPARNNRQSAINQNQFSEKCTSTLNVSKHIVHRLFHLLCQYNRLMMNMHGSNQWFWSLFCSTLQGLLFRFHPFRYSFASLFIFHFLPLFHSHLLPFTAMDLW